MKMTILLALESEHNSDSNGQVYYDQILTEEQLKAMKCKEIDLGTKEESEIFFFRTHFRINNRDSIPVYRVDASKYIVYAAAKKNASTEQYFSLEYDEENDVFYDTFSKKKNRYDVDSAILGTVNTGCYYLRLYDKQLNMLTRYIFKVFVAPSVLSISDYNDMVNDLIDMRTELAIRSNGKQSLTYNLDMEKIYCEIDKVKKYIEKICHNPINKIILENKMNRKENIKQYSGKVIEAYCKSIGKEKVNILSKVVTNDIYENRIILYVLQQLIKKIDCYLGRAIKQEEKIKNDFYKSLGQENEDDVNLQKILEERKKELIQSMYSYCKEQVRKNGQIIHVCIQIKDKDHFYSMNEKKLILQCMWKNKQPGYILAGKKYEYKDTELDERTEWKNKNVNTKTCKFSLEMHDWEMYYVFEKNFQNVDVNGFIDFCFIGHAKIASEGQYDKVTFSIYRLLYINGWKVTLADLKTEKYKNRKEGFEKYCALFMPEKSEEIELLKGQLNKLFITKENFEKNNIALEDASSMLLKLKGLILKISQMKVFRGISIRKKEQWKPSQIFSNDKYYSCVKKILMFLDLKLGLTEEISVSEVILHKITELYEVWVYIKMIWLLVNKMGWEIEQATFNSAIVREKDITLRYIIQVFFNISPSNIDGFKEIKITLLHKSKENHIFRMCVAYNCEVLAIKNEYNETLETKLLRPDYFFDISLYDQESKSNIGKLTRIYLDAKYHAYDSSLYLTGLNDPFFRDITDVALVKYTESFQSNEEQVCINKPRGSFIVHPCIDAEQGDIYTDFGGVLEPRFSTLLKEKYDLYQQYMKFYNANNGDVKSAKIQFNQHVNVAFSQYGYSYNNLFAASYYGKYPEYHKFKADLWQDIQNSCYNQCFIPINHTLGIFCFLPSRLEHFTTFIRMIFEYYFCENEVEESWNTCWRCEHGDDVTKKPIPLRGGIKYYLSCKNCGAFWVKTHCQKGHFLIKDSDENYHNSAEETKGKVSMKWHVRCPTCGDVLNNDKKHMFI